MDWPRITYRQIISPKPHLIQKSNTLIAPAFKPTVFTQLKKRDAVAGVCSCNHLYPYRNSNWESILEFTWSQEQTPATAMATWSI